MNGMISFDEVKDEASSFDRAGIDGEPAEGKDPTAVPLDCPQHEPDPTDP